MTLPPQPTTIANLPAVPNALSGNEFIALVQNGVTYRSLLSSIPFPSGGTPPVYVGGTSTGSANVQAVTVTPSNYAFLQDNIVIFTAGFSNTGSLTLNVNGTGAKTVQKISSSGLTNLTGGEIVSGGQYIVSVNGSIYQLNYSSASVVSYTPPGTSAKVTTVQNELQKGYLHSLDFAVGDGVTDDATNLSNWLSACGSLGLTGWLDPAPGGTYLIKSEVSYTTSADLSIMGPGYFSGASVTMNSLTQNGFYFNTAAKLYLSGFGITSSGTASAGAAFYFDGSANNNAYSQFDNLVTQTVYNGIYSSGALSYFTISRSIINGSNVGCYFPSPGDSSMYANFFGLSGSVPGGTAIVLTGDPGGFRLTNNKFNSGAAFGGCLSINASVSDGDLFVSGNSFEAFNGYGIVLAQGGSALFGNIIITGNEFSGVGPGIQFTSTTANWLKNITITGNTINTVTSGTSIVIESANYLTITGNVVDAGMAFGTNCVNGIVQGNVISGGSITNSSTGVIVVNNPGYNPVGASALSPGSSPWAYTAGASPECLFLSDSTAITALTLNGTSILPHATGANVVLTVPLPPFGIAVITNTGTLTAKTMIY